jgi:hypothetical protein
MSDLEYIHQSACRVTANLRITYQAGLFKKYISI